MRIGELFAGYGGLGMGVKAAMGGEVAWVSDVDKGANKVLAHRFPGVPNLGDITTVDWSGVEPVDVITAGFPCQPVSHAGKRLGDDDERWLWDDVARAVGALRPGLVVLENVRGLLTAGAGRLFGRVLGSLADLGYDAQWHGLRAADVGASHGRWRVFIVAADARGVRRDGRASVVGSGWGSSKWLETGDHFGNRRPSLAEVLVRRLGALPPEEHVRQINAARQRTVEENARLLQAATLLPTPAVNDMGEGKTPQAWDEWTAKMKAAHGNGNGHGPSLAIEAQRLLPTPNAGDAKQGFVSAEDHAAKRDRKAAEGVHLQDDLPQVATTAQWGQYADAIARWETLTRPAPPPTETGPKGNPRLNPAFSEWMMGLPAGWITDVPGVTRNEALKLAGNGVCPQQCEAALRILLPLAVAA